MASEVVNFRTTPQIVKQLDELVHEGHYRTRTEAINDAVRFLVRRYLALKAREQTFKVRKKLGRKKGDLTKALLENRDEEDELS